MNMLQYLFNRTAPERQLPPREEEELRMTQRTAQNLGLPPGQIPPEAQPQMFGGQGGVQMDNSYEGIRAQLQAMAAEGQDTFGLDSYARTMQAGMNPEISLNIGPDRFRQELPVGERLRLQGELGQMAVSGNPIGQMPAGQQPSTMRPNPTIPGAGPVLPTAPPAMIGAQFPTQAQPVPQPSAPTGVLSMGQGPVLIGGGVEPTLPFPLVDPNQGVQDPARLPVQERNVNAGFPSAFVPETPGPTMLNLPPSAPPRQPMVAPTGVDRLPVDAPRAPPVPPTITPRDMPQMIGADMPRQQPPAPQAGPTADELNRMELERFLSDEPMSIAPPAPSAPSSGLPRAAPTPPPAPPVPETAKPSGQGVPGPKAGQAVPEHLKDALLMEALRLTRAKRGMA